MNPFAKLYGEYYKLMNGKTPSCMTYVARFKACIDDQGLLTKEVSILKNCHKCKKTVNLSRHCEKCKYVPYCSPDCQTKDWSTHKLECIPLEKKIEILRQKTYHYSSKKLYSLVLEVCQYCTTLAFAFIENLEHVESDIQDPVHYCDSLTDFYSSVYYVLGMTKSDKEIADACVKHDLIRSERTFEESLSTYGDVTLLENEIAENMIPIVSRARDLYEKTVIYHQYLSCFDDNYQLLDVSAFLKELYLEIESVGENKAWIVTGVLMFVLYDCLMGYLPQDCPKSILNGRVELLEEIRNIFLFMGKIEYKAISIHKGDLEMIRLDDSEHVHYQMMRFYRQRGKSRSQSVKIWCPMVKLEESRVWWVCSQKNIKEFVDARDG